MGFHFGAGDRGRTDTVSLPLDFESSTSANSITPAKICRLICNGFYYNTSFLKNQDLFAKKIKKSFLPPVFASDT